MTQPLSPGAQAIWDALDMGDLNGPQQLVALAYAVAVLHAAADQPYEVPAWVGEDAYWTYRSGVGAERERNRSIATELERVNG